jgi:Domain of unknown function (DUF4129)
VAHGNRYRGDGVTRVSAPRRTAAAFDTIPLVLVIVGEAAWISVVSGVVQEYALGDPVLGIPLLAAFVTLGVAVARFVGRRAGNRWPPIALVVAVLGVVAGCLVSADARAHLASGDVAGFLSADPGCWLAGLAVVRGYAHAELPLAEATVTRLISAGLPGIAVLAILGGAIAEPWRGRFLDSTFTAAATFAATSIVASALVRLSAVGRGAGFDWRRNPAWAVLLVVLVVAIVLAASGSANVAGLAVEFTIGILLVPALIGGLLVGFGRSLRTIGLFVVAAAILSVVVNVVARVTGSGSAPGAPGVAAGGAGTTADQVVTVGLGGTALFVAVAAVLILARLWMNRLSAPAPDDVEETRWIDETVEPPSDRPRRLWSRRHAPVDAATAYVALVSDLESRPAVRRLPAETPTEHAARLRRVGTGRVALDLLAADYALGRFGGVRLSPAEDRRAIARWRRLRRELR